MLEDRYFEDYLPGSVLELGTVSATEPEIIEFAKRYDPQPMHTDPVAASAGAFGGVIASGWQTCVLTMQLFVPGYLSAASSLASPAIDELRFHRPVRPDDQLSVRVTVLDARASKAKPERGVVRSKLEARNAAGEVVLSMIVVNLIARRDIAG